MRHLLGFTVGVVFAPVLLYALGWGTVAAAASWSGGAGVPPARGVVAAAVLVLAGAGIAVLTRGVPPLGALVVGVAFVGLTVLYLAATPPAGMVPRSVGPVALDWSAVQEVLRRGLVGAVGAALLLSALPPSRWRRGRGVSPYRADDEDYLSFLAEGPDPVWATSQGGRHAGGHVHRVPPPTRAEPDLGPD